MSARNVTSLGSNFCIPTHRSFTSSCTLFSSLFEGFLMRWRRPERIRKFWFSPKQSEMPTTWRTSCEETATVPKPSTATRAKTSVTGLSHPFLVCFCFFSFCHSDTHSPVITPNLCGIASSGMSRYAAIWKYLIVWGTPQTLVFALKTPSSFACWLCARHA